MNRVASRRKRPLDLGDENVHDRALARGERPRQKRRKIKGTQSALQRVKDSLFGLLFGGMTSPAPSPTPSPPASTRKPSYEHDAYEEEPWSRSQLARGSAPEMRQVSGIEAYAAQAPKSGRIKISHAPRTPASNGATIERPQSALASSTLRSVPSSKTPLSTPATASSSRLPPAPSTSRLPPAPSSFGSGLRRRGSEGSMRDAMAAEQARSTRSRNLQRQRDENNQRAVDLCASEFGSAAAKPIRSDVDLIGKRAYQARLESIKQSRPSGPDPLLFRTLSIADKTRFEVARREARLSEHAQRAEQRHAELDAALDAAARGRRRQWRPALSPDEELKVADILRNGSFRKSISGAEVQAKDVRKLKPGQWLNDEVLNFYAVMLNNRSKAYDVEYDKACKAAAPGVPPPRELLRVHVFSSFFYSTLKEQGYVKVCRWTKKIDVFTLDRIIVPVNLDQAHWVCAAINIRQKRFEFFDSMGSWNADVVAVRVYASLLRLTVQLLRDYLEAEHLDKKKSTIDLSDWEDYVHPDVPQQQNGFDCGVFTSQAMECLSRPDAELDFSQENMTYLRKKLILEIAQNEFIDESY